MRQAQARLLAAGFKLSENEHIAGEKDWVYGVKYKGRTLTNASHFHRMGTCHPLPIAYHRLSARRRIG